MTTQDGASTVAGPLGAAWLSAHCGCSRILPEQREELKGQLLRELAARPDVHLGPSVDAELQRFLDSGRISESNLSRLERHLLARCRGSGAGGSRSARSEGSVFTVAGTSVASAAPSCRSARLRSAAALGAAPVSPRLPALPEEFRRSLQAPVEKWSQVAKYLKAQEEVEKFQKREHELTKQRQMAQDLQQQIEMKQKVKQARVEEEKWHYEQQEAEIERWRAAEAEKEVSVRRRALQVKQDRETQYAENQIRRDQERQAKLQEDFEQVERAKQELERERDNMAAKKESSRQRQQKLILESVQTRGDPKEMRRVQHEQERQTIDAYNRMLGEQELRNRPVIGEIRGADAKIVGLHSARKGQDFYTEENLMRQLKEANEAADRKERSKIDALRRQKEQNQDFLFQQIAERNRGREHALDQKRSQKLAAQADSMEHQETERNKVEVMRTKNVMHHLELEQQMVHRRCNAKPKSFEDKMTAAEKAINRRLIREAEDLKKQVAAAS